MCQINFFSPQLKRVSERHSTVVPVMAQAAHEVKEAFSQAKGAETSLPRFEKNIQVSVFHSNNFHF